jgi:uncharacterized protein YneF (UPF0154 family)
MDTSAIISICVIAAALIGSFFAREIVKKCCRKKQVEPIKRENVV